MAYIYRNECGLYFKLTPASGYTDKKKVEWLEDINQATLFGNVPDLHLRVQNLKGCTRLEAQETRIIKIVCRE